MYMCAGYIVLKHQLQLIKKTVEATQRNISNAYAKIIQNINGNYKKVYTMICTKVSITDAAAATTIEKIWKL